MRLRWLSITATIAILLALYFANRAYVDQRRAAERVAHWESEQKLEEWLDQTVEIKFGRRVPLQTWLDEFTRQTGVRFDVHDHEGRLPEDA